MSQTIAITIAFIGGNLGLWKLIASHALQEAKVARAALKEEQDAHAKTKHKLNEQESRLLQEGFSAMGRQKQN